MGNSHRMRPRFTMQVPLSQEDVIQRFSAVVNDPGQWCRGYIRGQRVLLRVPDEEQHLWSPHLNLESSPSSEPEGTVIDGLIGPAPVVWTFFMSGYAAIAFFAFVTTILGYAQWATKQMPWGFYLLPVLGALGLFLWGLSKMGQRLAKDQTNRLLEIFHQTLKEH